MKRTCIDVILAGVVFAVVGCAPAMTGPCREADYLRDRLHNPKISVQQRADLEKQLRLAEERCHGPRPRPGPHPRRRRP